MRTVPSASQIRISFSDALAATARLVRKLQSFRYAALYALTSPPTLSAVLRRELSSVCTM